MEKVRGVCGNDYARNVVIFDVDNSPTPHANNRKSNFLVLGKGNTFRINGNFGALEKKFSINYIKAKKKSCLHLHCNGDNNYLFVNGKEIFKFKTDNENAFFPAQFCLQSISNEFSATYPREVSFKGNVHHLSVDHNAIDKSETLIIHKYLMVKNNIK